MNLHQHLSPNYDQIIIPVGYMILHYTAVDLQGTLDIFMNPAGGVSAHLVIDVDGSVHEVVRCLEGQALRAWHAGVSLWNDKEAFNDFSIGIELVNYNGNLFSYTDAQYQSLQQVVTILQRYYPELRKPERVLGHEHIAGFRGKADPGLCFDWNRFFTGCYPNISAPSRENVCPDKLQRSLMVLKDMEPYEAKDKACYWQMFSGLTESAVKLFHQDIAQH